MKQSMHRFFLMSLLIASVTMIGTTEAIEKSRPFKEETTIDHSPATQQATKNMVIVDFAVIGAGPSGILVVGLLQDLGIEPRHIGWVDAEGFKVGRLSLYHNVPANAKTQMFLDFIKSCRVFGQCTTPGVEKLFSLDPEKEYQLETIIDPLQEITAYMRQQVLSFEDRLINLYFDPSLDKWHVILQSGKHMLARSVVLATGSHPRSLSYEECQHEIPLDEAIDIDQLAQRVDEQDTVAVVGSAHSAILILKYLSELPVARVFNFYKHSIVYPVQMDGWVLNDNTGLRGVTARWAKEVLEGDNPPIKIIRLKSNDTVLKTWLPVCTKIIYALGFDRNELPGNNDYEGYDPNTGVIGHRLFGIGIAFPEKYTDPLGNVEVAVGLPDFMEYALRVVPTWVQRDGTIIHRYEQFADLFFISVL